MTVPTKETSADVLQRFVPRLVLEHLAGGPLQLRAAQCETLRAGFLFADIAGFTALTERLARKGAAGAEQVASLLNDYFGRFIEEVVAAGGDVLKLAGDAALVVWRSDERVSLAACTRRALETALHLQRTLAGAAFAHDEPLATRIVVGAGDLLAMHVGGVYDRWELLVAGPAIAQLGALHDAAPGQVVLSSEGGALVADAVAGTRVGTALRVDQLLVEAEPLRRRSQADALAQEAVAAMWSYVPGAVRARLEAGQSAWLAELRNVTVLFIALPGARDADAHSLGSIDAQVRAVQTALYRYEGSLNKLSVDEKGITALAVIGLPPFAHEDNAARAVQAARKIHDDLAALGTRSAIGIAHGRTFCGVVGSERRCEYTVLGDTVNLAARLMQAAGDGILCDAPTREGAARRFEFATPTAIRVKGKAKPVAVYVPSGPIAATAARRAVVGRQAELRRMADRFQSLAAGRGGVFLLEGEAGIGKSCLIAEGVAQARAERFRVLESHTDPAERSIAYHAWRPVVAELLGLEPDVATPLEAVRSAVQRAAGSAQRDERLPLLNEVLALGLADSELTAEMRGQVRADNTRALLLDLLRAAAARGPLAVVVEDIHWSDSASLGLLFACARRLPSVLLVLTMRPLAADAADPELQRILGDPQTERLPLMPLGDDDVCALLARQLGAARLAERAGELITSRAQGNPFFSEELARSLQDRGVLVVRDGEAQLADGVYPEAVALPESVEAVITARVDRLTPDEQLTLKVASVLGRVFDLRLLRAVHPTISGEALDAVLAHLQERELLAADGRALEPTFAFRHALIVEAVYGLLLHEQRSRLHRAVAEQLERDGQEAGASPAHALLAHHWNRAGDEERALPSLEKAGEQALHSGAYAESVSFLGDAIGILKRTKAFSSEAPDLRVRMGRLHRRLGDAEFGLGDLDKARNHLERSLELLGAGAPWSMGVATRVVASIATQAMHRLSPPAIAPSSAAHDALLEPARAWSQLALLYFFCGEPEKILVASLSAVNLAERAEPSPELATACASLGMIAGLVGLHVVAQSYLRRGRKLAMAAGDRTAAGMVHAWEGIYWLGCGELVKARDEFVRAMPVLESIGDRRHWTEVACALSTVAHYEARFEERLGLGAEVSARGKDTRDAQSQAWGMLDRAESLIPLGREADAVALLEQVEPYLSSIPRSDQLWAHGLAAAALFRSGDRARARVEADAARALMKVVPPTNFWIMEGYAGATETYWGLWESLPAGAERLHMWAGFVDGVRALGKYFRALRFAAPRYHLCLGLKYWGEGRAPRAIAAWREAIDAAVWLRMPFEEARARFELGRHLAAGDPERQRSLEKALDGFDRIGAEFDRRRVLETLDRGAGATA